MAFYQNRCPFPGFLANDILPSLCNSTFPRRHCVDLSRQSFNRASSWYFPMGKYLFDDRSYFRHDCILLHIHPDQRDDGHGENRSLARRSCKNFRRIITSDFLPGDASAGHTISHFRNAFGVSLVHCQLRNSCSYRKSGGHHSHDDTDCTLSENGFLYGA